MMDLPAPEVDSAGAVGTALVATEVGVATGVGVETGVGEGVVAELDSGADAGVAVAVDEDVDSGDVAGARGVVVLRTGGWVICGRSCGRS